jgi:subtilisin family serine protease
MVCALAVAAPSALAAPDPLRAQQWGLDTIQADPAHATSTGSGAIVAVVDSGVLLSHEDLAGRLLPGFDFVDNDSDPSDTSSDPNVTPTGHGTHVTGIVAADANNGKGIEGVAPGAMVLPIRVLDASGSGTGEQVAKGIDYAVAHNADVINLSLGGDAISTIVGGDDAFTTAVQHALDKGVVVIAAAGNDTAPFCEQPAVTGPILCVGAIDRREMRSFYSSSGDLVAPGGSAFGGSGEDILSTFNDGGYVDMAGTSQATPHVSGVAALLVSLGLHGKAVTDRILATARDAGLAGPDDVYGAGILDAKAAVAGLKAPGGGSGGGSSGGGGAGGGGAGGGTGSTGGGGGGQQAGAEFKLVQRIKTVLRRGVRVRCYATAAGTCKVVVKARGRVIARGSRSVAANHHVTVAARATSKGKRLLRKVRKQIGARLIIDVPGGSRARAQITLKR